MSTNTEELSPLSKEVAKLMHEEVAHLRQELAEAVQQRQNYCDANGYLRLENQMLKDKIEAVEKALKP